MAIAMTNENRAKLNELVRLLRQGTVTKKDVMARYGVSERTARDMLREIALRVPLIAVSDAKGYRIAVGKEDVGDAMHAYNENSKRAEEIRKRNEPLEKFIEENRAG